MVKLHIKKGDESQFLFNTTVEIAIEDLLAEIVPIYNGRLKVHRICPGEWARHNNNAQLTNAVILLVVLLFIELRWV